MTFSYPGEKKKKKLHRLRVLSLAWHRTKNCSADIKRVNKFQLWDFILAVCLPRERSYSLIRFYSGSNADF